ncbi:MAG TPA: dTDP-4-dehydrorhamnose 3,5-epimerase family protein [Thermodesulfobacteriota bacterium]|nr:dTDP-4-dehydrorhamnose 3,5-epimerase family protein [Thermodesulfobacteriota bacterium]
MKVKGTELRDVLIIEPDAFPDQRGFFMETYHQEKYEGLGIREMKLSPRQASLLTDSRKAFAGIV